MSDYHSALEMRDRLAALVKSPEWISAFKDRVSEKSEDPSTAVTVLFAAVLDMVETDTIYFVNEIAGNMVVEYAAQIEKREQFIPEDFPSRIGFMAFNNAVYARDVDSVLFRGVFWKYFTSIPADPNPVAFLIFVVSINKPEFRHRAYLSPIIAATFLPTGELQIGALYEDGTDSDRVWPYQALPALDYFVCCSRFMRQKIASTIEASPQSKNARRTAQKKYGKIPTVKILILRKLERRELRRLSTPIERNYTCSWEVVGHDRHLKDGRIVKVRKYVKGPKDLPLRTYTDTVVNVSR